MHLFTEMAIILILTLQACSEVDLQHSDLPPTTPEESEVQMNEGTSGPLLDHSKVDSIGENLLSTPKVLDHPQRDQLGPLSKDSGAEGANSTAPDVLIPVPAPTVSVFSETGVNYTRTPHIENSTQIMMGNPAAETWTNNETLDIYNVTEKDTPLTHNSTVIESPITHNTSINPTLSYNTTETPLTNNTTMIVPHLTPNNTGNDMFTTPNTTDIDQSLTPNINTTVTATPITTVTDMPFIRNSTVNATTPGHNGMVTGTPPNTTATTPVSYSPTPNTTTQDASSPTNTSIGNDSEKAIFAETKKKSGVVWGAIIGTAIAGVFVGFITYTVLKSRRQRAFIHRKLIEDTPTEPVHHLDNDEPLNLRMDGMAYYNPTLSGDSIQMTNFAQGRLH